MLPYSYDVISIAIAEDAALMLYDDKGPLMLENAKKVDPSIKLTFEQFPHLSLRYLGYAYDNRYRPFLPYNTTAEQLDLINRPYAYQTDPTGQTYTTRLRSGA